MVMTMHDCGFWDCVTGYGVSDYLHLVKTKERDRTQKPNYSPPGQIAWGDIRLSVEQEVVGLSLLSLLWLLKSKEERRFRNRTAVCQDK